MGTGLADGISVSHYVLTLLLPIRCFDVDMSNAHTNYLQKKLNRLTSNKKPVVTARL